jgi:hypothetical protein
LGGAAERRVERRVTIVEKESRGGVVWEGFAKLLAGPRGWGMPCHGDVQDAAPIVGKGDEDEQRQVSVGTAKKSTATVEPRWFVRNVRQV